MDGIQLTLSERLLELEISLADGCYGECDDVDMEAFREDLRDVADTV